MSEVTDTPTKKRKVFISSREEPYPKRQRRTTESRRYSPSRYIKPDWEVPKGRGAALEDIPVIKDHVGQVSRNHEFLKQLHSIMYSHTCKTKDVKKNILAFTGLAKEFDDDEKKEWIENRLNSKSLKFLKNVHSFLGLKGDAKTMNQGEFCNEIYEFLSSPSKGQVVKKTFAFSLDNKKKPKKKAASKKKDTTKKKRRRSSSTGGSSKGESSADEKSDTEGSSKGSRGRKKKNDKSQSGDEGKSESETEKKEKRGRKRKSSEGSSKKESSKKKKQKTTEGLDPKSLEAGQFMVQYASTSAASCQDKDCKEKIKADEVRIGRASKNVHSKDDQCMMKWYHPQCLMNAQKRFRGESAKVESKKDLLGWDDLKAKDQKIVEKILEKAAKESKEED